MMTTGGKLQRVAVGEISTIGRNTQGVRIMSLGKNDQLAAVVRVPREEASNEDESGETEAAVEETAVATDPGTETPPDPPAAEESDSNPSEE